MNWLPIALIALGGFLIGGVVSLWRADARPPAVLCGVFAAAAIAGGILWML
ncbi:hypothetical protein [Nakamurella alba]|uniref:hypothetical protein n=1 Tax=Nakamurella alba TaxID=2665158 RepID=UPI001E3E4497|nr:hypothetical protein [Nakamurella alba]